MNLADRILAYRKAKGLSQEELAEVLNVSRQTISKWETGQSQPDLDKLLPLCELFEISADELLGKEIVKNTTQKKSLTKKQKLFFCMLLYLVAILAMPLLNLFQLANQLISMIIVFLLAIPTCLIIYLLFIHN